MSLLGLVIAFFFIPKASEIENPKATEATPPMGKKDMIEAFNPMNVFVQFTYPRILLAVRCDYPQTVTREC